MNNNGFSSFAGVQAAVEWNNAGVALLNREGDGSLLDHATAALKLGLNKTEELLRTMYSESVPGRYRPSCFHQIPFDVE